MPRENVDLVRAAYEAGSGAPLDAGASFVYELRDGAVLRDRAFTARSQALEAAGLSE